MRGNECYIKAGLMPFIITLPPILSFYYFGLNKNFLREIIIFKQINNNEHFKIQMDFFIHSS